jgi:hypothetical protein
LRFVQASSQDLQWTFSNTVSSAQNLTGATSVIFGYAPESRAWSVVVTGAVSSAANGQVLVSFTPANLNTNGLFDWVLQVNAGSTSTLAYAYGKLQIVPDPLSGITNSLTQTTYINWSLYTFANTYTEGPVRVTGAVGVTTNSDGSVTYDVTDPVVSISGSSPIGITTSGTDRTVYLQASSVTGLVGSAIESGTVADARIASTIARDSEVSTATGLTYAAAVAYSDSLAANYATAAQGIAATNAQARVAIVETNTVLRDGSKTLTASWNVGNQSITNAGLFQSVVGFGMPTIDMGGGLYRYGWTITTESGGAGEEYGAYVNAPWRTPYRLAVGNASGDAMRFGKREIGYGELGAYDLTDPDINIARYEGWALGRPAGVTTQLTLRIRQGSFRFGVGGSTNGEDTVFGYWDSDGWDWAGYRLRKTGWPTATNDAANKAYVDAGTNTLQIAITSANANATNAQARCTLLEKTPLVVPFIATNVAYETAWIMRPISDQTITQIIAKCDVGTGAVWFVTQSLTDGWRTFSTTNAISVSTTGDYYTTAMTITNGTMFGYQYKGGTCTQGVFFVYSQ